MTKIEIYKIRELTNNILYLFHLDVGTGVQSRASNIQNNVNEILDICNKSINKMEPLKMKK